MTLYTRHKQPIDLTFSVISTERKYVNYLIRLKGLLFIHRLCIHSQREERPGAIDTEANPNRPSVQQAIERGGLYCTV